MSNRIAESIFGYIYKSPAFKTWAFVLSVILSNILGGAFLMEIFIKGVIRWDMFYLTKSFYLIIIWGIVVYVYNRYAYIYEMDIIKFKDNEYCSAYIRSQCLPELAKKYNESIKNGQMSELRNIMQAVKGIIK